MGTPRTEKEKQQHKASMQKYLKRKAVEWKWLKAKTTRLAKEMVENGTVDKLSPQMQDFIHDVYDLIPIRVPPTLETMFGGEAVVGKRVKARDVLYKLYKGKTELSTILNRWRRQGIIVRYEPDPEGDVLDAEYVLEALPQILPKDFEPNDIEREALVK